MLCTFWSLMCIAMHTKLVFLLKLYCGCHGFPPAQSLGNMRVTWCTIPRWFCKSVIPNVVTWICPLYTEVGAILVGGSIFFFTVGELLTCVCLCWSHKFQCKENFTSRLLAAGPRGEEGRHSKVLAMKFGICSTNCKVGRIITLTSEWSCFCKENFSSL